MEQQQGYNPYNANQGQAQPQAAPGGGPYQNQNPFNNQDQGPKKLSLPTWLVWLVVIGFIGLCGFLIWYLYF